MSRISSANAGYVTGQLSLFPQARDTRYQLYEATNNSQTTLKQSLTYAGKTVIAEDSTGFPASGIIRIGPPAGIQGPAEFVYYDKLSGNTFRNLIRGFAGSRQNPWPIGSFVSNAVFAEHHNAVKDAVIQLERDLGVNFLPEDISLNGILKTQETRFLSPRPVFQAYPFKGPPPLKVRFQNFSTGPLVRYLWDFGDGTTSVEKSPSHTYLKEGLYTVKLNVITTLGAQGVVTKSNYITVSEHERKPFFYATPNQGISRATADAMTLSGNPTSPTTFAMVDQTDGNIVQRYWIFDGPGSHGGIAVPSQSITEYDPNVHSTSYVYDLPGEYEPSVLILLDDQKLQRAVLGGKITVT